MDFLCDIYIIHISHFGIGAFVLNLQKTVFASVGSVGENKFSFSKNISKDKIYPSYSYSCNTYYIIFSALSPNQPVKRLGNRKSFFAFSKKV